MAAVPMTDPVLPLKNHVDDTMATRLLSMVEVRAIKPADCTNPFPKPLQQMSVHLDTGGKVINIPRNDVQRLEPTGVTMPS